MLDGYKILTVTHREVPLEDIGSFILPHSEEQPLQDLLVDLKNTFQLSEFLYIATCNRVIFLFHKDTTLDIPFLHRFFQQVNPDLSQEKIQESVAIYEGNEAIIHLYEVAASIDSLVVGEREIMRQIRDGYHQCDAWNLTGDHIRLLMKYLVQAIKEVYAKTRIGEKPVSVVSLAMHLLAERNLSKEAGILLVGAGQTNTLVSKFLLKKGFTNITVFNRTVEKAIQLAKSIKGRGYALSELATYQDAFELMVVCTGATQPIIDTVLYQQLVKKERQQKVIVDLSIPNNVSAEVIQQFPIDYIDISELKELAELNLSYRKQEIGLVKMLLEKQLKDFKQAYKGRQIEVAMGQVPVQIKEIKKKAMDEVFKKELDVLDDNTLALINKMMTYMEKKCIGIPMKVAKNMVKEGSNT